jgi:hypothetical protein
MPKADWKIREKGMIRQLLLIRLMMYFDACQCALKAIPLRIMLLNHPDGITSILLTHLPEKKEFSAAEMINLYCRRWVVENFHSKSVDGIQQELFD